MTRQTAALLVAFFSMLTTIAEVSADSLHVLKGRIIRSLAIDPADQSHVLVGQKGAKTGSALIFQSLDGGKNWRTLNGNQPLHSKATDVQAVAIVSKEILLAGTWKHGLYRSSNGGKNFAKLANFPSQDIRDLQIKDGVIFAATGRDGVFASSDLGGSWKALGPKNDFLWSLTAMQEGLFASSPEAGVFEMRSAAWDNIFHRDKAYAIAAHKTDQRWLAIAGETGLYATSGDGWRTFLAGEKFADVLILDDKYLLAASWSNGVSVLAVDGEEQKRLLGNQAVIHLQHADDQLFAGSWGDGLHILPIADVLP